MKREGVMDVNEEIKIPKDVFVIRRKYSLSAALMSVKVPYSTL